VCVEEALYKVPYDYTQIKILISQIKHTKKGEPGVFYKCLALFYIGLSRSPSGYFKPLLDPDGGFNSETAVA
jgi:hypothetical protein